MKHLPKYYTDDLAIPFLTYQKIAFTNAHQMTEAFDVDTLEGLMTGRAGDYLARGIHGELYPIRKEIFEKSYELI